MKPLISKAFRGKKPKALAGGTSKKLRHKWKTAKGQIFPRKKPGLVAKKKFMKFVYVWGFGGSLSGIYGEIGLIILFPKRRGKYEKVNQALKRIDLMFGEMQRHYKRIGNPLIKYKSDPDFKSIIFVQKKLPELGRLIKKFKQNRSEKSAEAIYILIEKLNEEGLKFREIAKKYGLLSEIGQEDRKGYPEEYQSAKLS